MPDIDISKIAGSLMPALKEKQIGFIVKYLDKDYQSKYSELQGKFQTVCATITISLARLRTIVDQLELVGKTPADLERVKDLRTRTGAVITGLSKSTSSRKDALKMLETAKVTLETIRGEAERYMDKVLTGEGRDLGKASTIELKKLAVMNRMGKLEQVFALENQAVLQRVQEAAPGLAYEAPAKLVFDTAFITYRRDVQAVPLNDPGMTAEQAVAALDTLQKAMDLTANTQIRALRGQIASPGFAPFLADMKLKAAVEAKLNEAGEWLVTLDRWESPQRMGVREEIGRITAEIPEVFKNRDGVAPNEVAGHETRQKDLMTAASRLVMTAGQAAQAESELFAQEQAKLEQELRGLEGRLKAVAKTVPKSQLTQMQGSLATTRMGITGLNGCNFDALKTGRLLLDQAAQMVSYAERIDIINGAIENDIKEAKKLAGARTKDTNPLSAKLLELVTEIDTFAKDWKTKDPAEARNGAIDLLKRATDVSKENDDIIKRRAEVAQIIRQVEAQLGKLNLAFKDLAKGSPAADTDYRGDLMGALDTCKSWNATKTSLTFYDTIVIKLANLTKAIDQKLNDINSMKGVSDQDILLRGLEADRLYRETVAKINAKGGEDGPDLGELRKAREVYDAEMGLIGTKSDLLAEANKATADDEKDRQDRATFLTDSKAFEEEIKKQQKAAEDDAPINAYGDEVQRHLDRLKTTRDLIRKNEPGTNGAAAMSELKFVQATIQRIRDRGQKTSKSALGAIADQWVDAVGKFATKCTELMDKVDTFAVQLEDPADVKAAQTGAEDANKVLSRIMGQMNAHKFGAPAAVLGSETADATARRAAREQALDEVRRLRKVIFDDPVLQKCVVNPFGVGGIGAPVQYRLEEIELNVLRGV